MADTSGVGDADGLTEVSYSYQWLADDADIAEAASARYTLTDSEEGKAIKVRVSFTDDAGNEETGAYQRGHGSSSALSEQSCHGGTRHLGRAQPRNYPGVTYWKHHRRQRSRRCFLLLPVAGRRRPHSGRRRPKIHCRLGRRGQEHHRPGRVRRRRRKRGNAQQPAGQPRPAGLTATVSDQTVVLNWFPPGNFRYLYDYRIMRQRPELGDAEPVFLVDTGNDETTYTDRDVQPGVLYVYTIHAANFFNGISQASLTAQVRTPIGETPENSPATGQPTITGTAQVGQTLTAGTVGIADEDGLEKVSYSYQWLADASDITDATGDTYTLLAADEGKTVKVKVTFTDDADNEETLTSTATDPVAPLPNNPATGAPIITGTVQVGETLTVDITGIEDPDGMDGVQFSYQWISNDRTSDSDITDATGDTYTLLDVDEGKTIKVTLSFTDDAGNEETLTSAATSTVAAAPIPLTASVHDAPESHDGENAFTFELRLSEEPVSTFSYGTLRDHAFTVTGGEVTKAGRLGAPGNVRWEITMTPDGDGNVTVVLPVTQDCAEEGAICTGDGRMLSAEVTLVVTGPGDEEEQNSPATGQPAISGTLQVGETLTADTSGIADDDGLDNATFSYQWLADDVDISGATGDRYTLTDSEEGKAVKVRVSFTDDAGNEETLTSAATSTVAGRPLSLDDFDAGDGQTVLASALVRVGNRGRKSNGNQDRAWYASATSAWHASGKLRDGVACVERHDVEPGALLLGHRFVPVQRGRRCPHRRVFRRRGRQPRADGLGSDGDGGGVVPGEGQHTEIWLGLYQLRDAHGYQVGAGWSV